MPKSKLAQPPHLRLDLLVEEYERDMKRREFQPKTIRNYRKALSLALRFWDERLGRPATLDDFTVRQAEAFLDHLLERGKLHPTGLHALGVPLSSSTLRAYVRTLKVFSSWLVAPKQHYTEENRLATLPMPRRTNTYKLPLDVKEIQALIRAFSSEREASTVGTPHEKGVPLHEESTSA